MDLVLLLWVLVLWVFMQWEILQNNRNTKAEAREQAASCGLEFLYVLSPALLPTGIEMTWGHDTTSLAFLKIDQGDFAALPPSE